jgi:hypothetical protein
MSRTRPKVGLLVNHIHLKYCSQSAVRSAPSPRTSSCSISRADNLLKESAASIRIALHDLCTHRPPFLMFFLDSILRLCLRAVISLCSELAAGQFVYKACPVEHWRPLLFR